MAHQLAFEWPGHTSYAIEDFIVSDCNETAFYFLQSWPEQAAVALLGGPVVSGKTHLAQCWLQRVGGIVLDARLLGVVPSDMFWSSPAPALLEDIELLRDEAALFHLLRHAETDGKTLLLSSALAAKQLPFTLPDLCSRLAALPAVSIAAPDETILLMFILKFFADRQLRVAEDVAAYIVRRAERSFAAVLAVIQRVEKLSMEQKRDITLPLVKQVL